MTRNFCKSDDYAVFNVEYRLAPEHPFPAGLEDCISAYRYLTQQGVRGGNMVFAGDSAGDNLAFALALYLRDHGMELPAGLCTLSPVGALDDSMPSRKERVDRDCIIGAGALVPQGMEIPDGSLAFGSPAKVRRALTEEEIASNRAAAEFYCREAAEYAE